MKRKMYDKETTITLNVSDVALVMRKDKDNGPGEVEMYLPNLKPVAKVPFNAYLLGALVRALKHKETLEYILDGFDHDMKDVITDQAKKEEGEA